MPTLKINREFTNIEIGGDKITFLLNGIVVYINYANNYMHTRPNSAGNKSTFWTDNITLVNFATAILNGGPTGFVTFDSSNKDILDFLKATKCLL